MAILAACRQDRLRGGMLDFKKPGCCIATSLCPM
jgi:hypothetical protein